MQLCGSYSLLFPQCLAQHFCPVKINWMNYLNILRQLFAYNPSDSTSADLNILHLYSKFLLNVIMGSATWSEMMYNETISP